MATTTPDAIYSADTSTPYSLATITATMASSVQTALNARQIHTFQWANITARNAQTGMVAGDLGFQQDTLSTYQYSGTAWGAFGNTQWTSYTPATTGITVGSTGSVAAQYRFIGTKIEVRIVINFAGTGVAMGSNPTYTLPFPAVVPPMQYFTYSGVGSMFIAGSVYPLFTVANVSSQTACLFYALSPSTSGYASITASVPNTWAAGSAMGLSFTYDPA